MTGTDARIQSALSAVMPTISHRAPPVPVRPSPTSSASMMGAGAEHEPRWYTELAAANSAVGSTFFDERTIRRRACLLRDVKTRSTDANAWVAYLRFLNAERKRDMKALPSRSPRRVTMYRALLRLYQVAVGVVPQSATNRHSSTYLKLWLDLAVLTAEDPEARSEARDIFKLIKMQRIGHYIPAFYETWAAFEEHCKNYAKAAKLRDDAAKCRPVERRNPVSASKRIASVSEATVLKPTTDQLRSENAMSVIPADTKNKPPPYRVQSNTKQDTPLLGTQVTTEEKKEAGMPLGPDRSTSQAKLISKTLKASISPQADGKENIMPSTAEPMINVKHGIEKIGRKENVDSAINQKSMRSDSSNCLNEIHTDMNVRGVREDHKKSTYGSRMQKEQVEIVYNTARAKSVSSTKEPMSSESERETSQTSSREQRLQHSDSNSSGGSSSGSSSVEKPRNLEGKRSTAGTRSIYRPGQQREIASRRCNPEISKRTRFERLMSSENRVFVNGKPYQLLGRVGKGGSSQVYKVLSEDLQVLALKRVQVSPGNVSALESYANEIQLLESLVGRSTIVQLHDAEVQKKNGLIHVVMECGDIDLAKLLSREKAKKMEYDVMRTYWRQMLDAVHTIHENRIVHGDLKPANFISISGKLKLIDFGIAKAIIADDTTKIFRDSPVGTPNYMSPEALKAMDDEDDPDRLLENMDSAQRRYRYRVGRASDIWSLGCILYQMVYGKTPFAHIRDTYRKALRIKDPTYEITFRGIDNPDLLDVLRGCLQRDPEKRMTIPELQAHTFLRSSSCSSTQGAESERALAHAILNALKCKGIEFCETNGSSVKTDRLMHTLESCLRPLMHSNPLSVKTASKDDDPMRKVFDDSSCGHRMPTTPSVSAITKSEKTAAYSN